MRTNHKSYGLYYYLDQYTKDFKGREVNWMLNDFDGYLMLIHEPSELPSANSVQVHAMVEKNVDVFVTPEITKMDESLSALSYDE